MNQRLKTFNAKICNLAGKMQVFFSPEVKVAPRDIICTGTMTGESGTMVEGYAASGCGLGLKAEGYAVPRETLGHQIK